MLSTKIQLSIPQPCQENWEEMTSVEKGKFCTSCQKKVFDFTNTSDRELLNLLENNSSLCGRFRQEQLERELIKPQEKSPLWMAVTTSLISLLSLNEITSQEKVKIEQTDRKILDDNSIKTDNKEIEVTGIISDEFGPLPGANIVIKGTTIGTQTDFDGNFKIKAKVGAVLEISSVGYETLEYVVSSKKIDVKLVLGSYITLGAVCTIKKRTFFGKIFHSIGNLFR